MAEILSQEEIDALLTSVGEGKEEKPAEAVKEKAKAGKAIRVYDFSSPDKFSKDQIRTLQMLHEGFTRMLNSSLSAYLRVVIQTVLVSVTEQSYEEFIKTLPNPTVLGVFSMSPLEGSAIVEINPRLMFAMYDRLLGGQGVVPDEIRELTDIEQSVIEGIFLRILGSLRDAWVNIIQLEPKLEALETNPIFSQIVSPNDRVAVIVFEMKFSEITGVINICIPHLVIEPIASKLSAQLWFSGTYKGSSAEGLEILRKKLEKALIPVVVELGNTTINLKDVLQLQVGDVIRLDKFVDSKLEVRVGNRVKFLARPGVTKGKVAVQITNKIFEGGGA